jgi:hypothetical protein
MHVARLKFSIDIKFYFETLSRTMAQGKVMIWEGGRGLGWYKTRLGLAFQYHTQVGSKFGTLTTMYTGKALKGHGS